jgi:hypothetical protein
MKHPADVTSGRVGEMVALIDRLRVIIERSDLDCACRETFSHALDRFSSLEARRISRSHLIEAREQKQRIVAILDFLQELDQLTEGETDLSVFREIALLFEEISRSALAGARAINRLDGVQSHPDERPQDGG